MILLWPLVRMLGLRAASAAMGAVMSPFWRWVILGVALFAAFAWWSEHQRDAGREEERAAFAQASAEAEARALKAAIETEAQRQAREIRDEKELAVTAEAEAKVRDANSGDGVLWRSDDGWLRAKRPAKGDR